MVDEDSVSTVMALKSRATLVDPSEELGFFSQRPYVRFVSLAGLFVFAIALRVSAFDASSVIAERQFRSALIARVYYYNHLDSIPEWRKQVARISAQREDMLEPPIMEFLVSSMYWLVGGEHLWIARLFSTTFWMIGGIFLFKIAKKVISVDAAVYAVAYYLFVPVGIRISIGFLPDPLMIMMFLFSIFTILRYCEKSSSPRLAIAAIVSALAILVKPLALFVIFGAFISLAVYKQFAWNRIFSFSTCLLPAAVYYLYGIFAGRFLTTQAHVSFLPNLLLHIEYWGGWLLTAVDAVGYTPLLAALLGVQLLRKGVPRALLIGLSIGYIVFGLVFTYHIRFASHYHLQLVIIVALSFSAFITFVINQMRRVVTERYWWVPVIGVVLLVLLLNISGVWRELGTPMFERKEVAQEIGKTVGHSSKTVFLAPYYGRPLEYYGELTGVYWPRGIKDWALKRPGERALSVEERFNAIDFSPEYFIITDFEEFEKHHADLKAFLAKNAPLIVKNDRYLIYRLKGVNLAEAPEQ